MQAREPASSRAGGLLTPSEVAAEYGIAEQTLANWRWMRRGPDFVKTSPGRGGRVIYRRSAIEKWLNQHTVQTAPA